MSDKDLQLRIEQYIEGVLPENEVDTLWSQLIDRPEYREYLETLNNLKKARETKDPSASRPD
jgi:hypothetical protein